MNDESLDLAQVQSAFREAESKFQELAQAAQDLDSVSKQLGDARTVLAEAGTELGSLAEASRSVSEQLADATRAIEATDPAEIQRRLSAVSQSLEEHSQSSAELFAALEGSQRAAEENRRAGQRTQLVISVAILLAVIAVGVLILIP